MLVEATRNLGVKDPVSALQDGRLRKGHLCYMSIPELDLIVSIHRRNWALIRFRPTSSGVENLVMSWWLVGMLPTSSRASPIFAESASTTLLRTISQVKNLERKGN